MHCFLCIPLGKHVLCLTHAKQSQVPGVAVTISRAAVAAARWRGFSFSNQFRREGHAPSGGPCIVTWRNTSGGNALTWSRVRRIDAQFNRFPDPGPPSSPSLCPPICQRRPVRSWETVSRRQHARPQRRRRSTILTKS